MAEVEFPLPVLILLQFPDKKGITWWKKAHETEQSL